MGPGDHVKFTPNPTGERYKPMVEYSSTKRVESKVMPGVAFVFRVMTDGVRNRLSLTLADSLIKIRDLRADMDSLDLPRLEDGEIDNQTQMTPRVAAEMHKIVDKIQRLTRADINPCYFKACFVRVEELCIDGKMTFTPEEFIDLAPEDLYKEIVENIRAEAEMSSAERGNLGSPTTSAVEEGGPTIVTTAALVDVKDCTKELETASVSSQS